MFNGLIFLFKFLMMKNIDLLMKNDYKTHRHCQPKTSAKNKTIWPEQSATTSKCPQTTIHATTITKRRSLRRIPMRITQMQRLFQKQQMLRYTYTTGSSKTILMTNNYNTQGI
jgi:hypothetical protein